MTERQKEQGQASQVGQADQGNPDDLSQRLNREGPDGEANEIDLLFNEREFKPERSRPKRQEAQEEAPAEEEPASEEPAESEGGEPDGGQEAQPGKSEAREDERADERSLREQLEEARRVIAALSKQTRTEEKPKQAEPARPDPAREEQELYSAYTYAIPTEIVEGIASEDRGERSAALQQLIQGVAVGVHRRVTAAYREELGSLRQTLGGQISQHMQGAVSQQAVAQDFYGRFPHLKNERLVPLVVAEGRRLAQEMGVSGYTPEFGSELAKRVDGLIGRQGAPAPKAPPAPKKRSDQPANFGTSSSRPAQSRLDGSDTVKPNSAEDILTTFS